MKKIYISREFDPYYNIAAENRLFLESDEDIHMFLWQNDASVIIGRNQNIYAECNPEYLKEQGIKAARRFSGGGAVYHDRGNINFTFIIKEKRAKQVKLNDLLLEAMARLGIDCEFSGRNDLLYMNKKFSGLAYYMDGNNYMYHGTILVNVDMEQLEKTLTPSILKLQSKGVTSVRNRVINLSSVYNELTADKVIQAFIEAFGVSNIEYIDRTNFEAPLMQFISSYEWLYAGSPKFNIEFERRYSSGNITVHIAVSDGVIKSAVINTDSLHLYDFKPCESMLAGKNYDENSVWECIEQFISGSQ